MPLSNLGITKADFENFAFADLSRSLTWVPRIKGVSNVTGSPTFTNGTSVVIQGIFTKRSTSYDWQKDGFLEQGDAFVQVKESVDLKVEDLIETGDEIFRVAEVILRDPQGIRFFNSCSLFKIQTEDE